MFGVDAYTPVACTVTVSSGVVRMSPCTPRRTRHRAAVHSDPFSGMLVALSAVVAPLIGLPCCAHVVPPSVVASVVPVLPDAKHASGLTHATPFRVCVVLLVCGPH